MVRKHATTVLPIAAGTLIVGLAGCSALQQDAKPASSRTETVHSTTTVHAKTKTKTARAAPRTVTRTVTARSHDDGDAHDSSDGGGRSDRHAAQGMAGDADTVVNKLTDRIRCAGHWEDVSGGNVEAQHCTGSELYVSAFDNPDDIRDFVSVLKEDEDAYHGYYIAHGYNWAIVNDGKSVLQTAEHQAHVSAPIEAVRDAA